MHSLQCLPPENNSSFFELGRQAIQKLKLCPEGSQPIQIPDEGDRLNQGLDRCIAEVQALTESIKQLAESEAPESSAIIPFPGQESHSPDGSEAPILKIEEPEPPGQSDNGQQEPELASRRNLAFWHSTLEQARLSVYARAVYTHLVMRGNKDGKHAYPSITTIAQSCSVSRTAVIKAIVELERTGLIVVKRAEGKVSHYIIRSLEQWQACQLPAVENQSIYGPVSNQSTYGLVTNQSTTVTAPVHVVDSKEIKERDPIKI